MKPGIDFTGISVGFFCHDNKGNILMHKRSNKTRDEHGRWDNGGGRLEFDEDPETGVLRELREEHGCDGIIEAMPYPVSVHREWDGIKTHWLTFPFIIKVDPAQVSIIDKNAIDEIGWFTLDNLPEPLHTGFQKVLETHRKIFEQYITKKL